MTPDIRSIRARARAVFKRAGIEYAKSYPSCIAGWRAWSRGVTIDPSLLGDALAGITPRYDRYEARRQDRAAAIAALRSAGWTVDDDGRILALPENA